MADVLVLCYHAVSERWPAELSVTPAAIEEQLDLLVGRGFRGSRFSDALAARSGDRVLAVTFDDAYRSVIKIAFPILSRLGLPATVFAPTGFVGAEGPMTWPGIDRWLEGPYESELEAMSWEELGRLREAGWEVGSHSRSHPHLTSLDDRSLAAEFQESRKLCEERLGAPCRSVAYPYGDVDDRVVAAAAEAGYRAGAALGSSLRTRGPLEWPRVGVYHRDSAARFRLKVSRGSRLVRSSGMWEAVNRARR